MRLNKGLVFMSDTRTNAGFDNFSTARKMFTWCIEGERSITLMTAGNLATTQAMVSLLEERSKAAEERDPSILTQPTMFQVARLVGATLKEVISYSSPTGQTSDDTFSASVVVGGQIKGGQPTLFLVYPEGNFVEVTEDTPFYQIGETKYGRPILVRAFDPAMSFSSAIRLLLVSFDSTIKANLTVGPPLDFHIYRSGTLRSGQHGRIEAEDGYVQAISNQWGDALQDALESLPEFKIED
jgi:putative proteasome-type protease